MGRALLRANRAEDLAEARKRLGEQAQLVVKQKERIDYLLNFSTLKRVEKEWSLQPPPARESVPLQPEEVKWKCIKEA